MNALPPVAGALLALLQAPLTAHDRTHSAMFWVGALFALTPVAIGFFVLGFVLYQRRRSRPSPPEPPRE